MKKIIIRPSTELYIGKTILKNNQLFKIFNPQRLILVADETICDLYATDLAQEIQAELLTIPGGEHAKNLVVQQSLMDQLFKMGCARDSCLIAMGGGVTTDLVAFIASIYMRGIPLILIPTTLLAMVDAAIGGKTAIDTPYGKNLIGTIYYPQAIFADLDLLQTLPEKEWFNGLAEILKMGLIYDDSIWEMAERNSKDPDLILKAILGKIGIVEQDPREHSLRRILNFGHTIGHALEKSSGYKMAHGEAVALGSLVESHLSFQLGYLAEKEFGKIQRMYQNFSLQIPTNYSRAQLMEAIAYDKKKYEGQNRFVLIDKIGHAMPFDGKYCRAVSCSELSPTLDWMENIPCIK